MPAISDPLKHLQRDPVLKGVCGKIQLSPPKKQTDLYLSLLRAIVGQQLSVKAASTIWGRFLNLFKEGYPEAKKVLKLSDEKLRTVGLSYQKAGYLKNIARFALERTLDYRKLKQKTDDELIDYLAQIKGVGRWTVEMILMFNLQRPDIFPVDDLGIQNAIKMLYNIRCDSKKEMMGAMMALSEKWRPHRSLACFYLWKYKDMQAAAGLIKK